ncbi:MAG TPA: TIM barrel protein [Herpetosiphonaceae bacterium]|nr:TIM barrel protein [Herpetosiphonaceae bacterium]
MPIHIANAPCSWGVLEFDLASEAIPYPRVLDEIATTGYAGTELGDYGFMPTDAAALRAELEGRCLQLVGAFVPVPLERPEAHAAGADEALKIARLLRAASDGAPFVVLAAENGVDPVRTRHAGRIRPEQGLSDEQWLTFARGVEHVAGVVREQTGLRTVFHHHCAGYVETPAEVDRLLELTDPDLLGLCLDTGHYLYAGGNPLLALRRHANRVWHVHFKDCHPEVAQHARAEGWDYFRAVREGVFCELGQGSVEFAEIAAELKQVHDGWIVVEQDVLPGMGTPAESAARNRAFLRSVGL